MTASHGGCRTITMLAAISATAAAMSLVVASSASAAPGTRAASLASARQPARTIAGGPAAAPAERRGPAGGVTLQTLVAGVQVFDSPSMASKVAGKVTASGTSVTLSCWTTGVSYAGDPIWYAITAPEAGYVPAYDMAAHFAPVGGVSHCAKPAFGRNYHALATFLKIRSLPSLTASVVATLGPIGSSAYVTCYTTGSAVLGDSTWYLAATPAKGYISGRYLNTGGDPAPGVPRC